MPIRWTALFSLALLSMACGTAAPPPAPPPAPEAQQEPAGAPIAPVEEGEGEATAEAGAIQVFIVRHAEKQKGDDPALTEAGAKRAGAISKLLADQELAAIITTQLRRTQDTARPTAEAKGMELTIVPIEGDVAPHAAAVASAARDAGGHVLIVGHSNTLPDIVEAFGAERPEPIEDSDYDNLFVVELQADGTAVAERRVLPRE